LALVHPFLRGLRSWGLKPPTTANSFDFAPRFATRILHNKKGRGALAPGPTRILRLLQDVPEQRDAVKNYFTK
jgi:hypothetical protein